LPRKSQRGSYTNLFAMYGNAAVVRSTIGRWMERVTVSETGSGVPGFASLRLSCHAEA